MRDGWRTVDLRIVLHSRVFSSAHTSIFSLYLCEHTDMLIGIEFLALCISLIVNSYSRFIFLF